MQHEFRMPDAGEGLTEAEVLAWRVTVGDAVEVNQILLEVETAKAAVELPSPYAGTVVALLAAVGDVVPVGQPIIRIDDGSTEPAGGSHQPAAATSALPDAAPGSAFAPGAAAAPASTGAAAASTDRVNAAFGAEFGAHSTHGTAEPSGGEGDDAEGDDAAAPVAAAGTGESPSSPAPAREAVLVGYGVRTGPAPQRRPRSGPHGTPQVEPGPPGVAARPVRYGGLEQARAVEERLSDARALAKPPVRRLARDLGIDLGQVRATGPGGVITHDDVTRAAQTSAQSEVVPRTHVARMMAHAMTESAFTAPHVTEWVDVDVTAMSALVRAARQRPDLADLPITPLTFAALGLVRAAVAHPTINASLDESGDNLLVHRGVHLGIAVDSPRGLLVPHLRDAQLLGLRGMAQALGDLVATARAGRSRPEDLRGSTITLTNVGVFGVDGGTPILNPGEVAILAVGRVLARPWVVEGAVLPRDVVTLSLSFDHRVVDGALGSRVLREVADFMADPATALALGC